MVLEEYQVEVGSTLQAQPRCLKQLWCTFGQVFLFGLLGGALDFKQVRSDILYTVVAVVLIGLPFRTIAAFYTAAVARWSVSERLFTALSWIPKATVQAALSTVALQYVEEHSDE